MIVVIDYGMGNLRSVSKALESLGASVRVSSDPHEVAQAQKLILPGVGAFPAAMRELNARGLVEPIKVAIAFGKPYLGICLGLQLLFERGEEGEGADGLGILPGTVRRFGPGSHLKIPHMGWNQVMRTQEKPNIPVILAKDLHIDVYEPSKAVRLRHIPTGLIVTCEDEPSQLRNKEKAMRLLSEKLRGQGQSDVTGPRECPLLNGIPDGSFVYFVHSYYANPADRSIIALESEYSIRFTAMVWQGNLYATQFHPEKSQTLGLRLLKNFIEL